MVTVFSAGNENKVGEKRAENVTEKRVDLILRQLRRNNTITVEQLAEKFNVTQRTIIRDIEKMKNKGLIRRIGPAKGGHWEIINKRPNDQ